MAAACAKSYNDQDVRWFWKNVSPLDGQHLEYVNEVCYLGHITTNKLKHDADTGRELHKSYSRINVLIRRFSHCSVAVKRGLFRSYIYLRAVGRKVL